MEKIPAMQDMRRTPKEKAEVVGSAMSTMADSIPDYPWGLSISLSEEELEKLGLDETDLSVGDILHLHALVKVTSVSSTDNGGGKCCRVELQITHLCGSESEDDENEEAEAALSIPHEKRRSRLYKG